MATREDLYPTLDAAVRDLAALGNEIGSGETMSAEQRAKLADITRRLQDAVTRFEVVSAARPAAPSSERADGAGPKYPAVEVKLADLGDDVYAIMRRISYAMGDAEIDDEKVAWFKAELKSSGDPVAVAKSWVTVTDR